MMNMIKNMFIQMTIQITKLKFIKKPVTRTYSQTLEALSLAMLELATLAVWFI